LGAQRREEEERDTRNLQLSDTEEKRKRQEIERGKREKKRGEALATDFRRSCGSSHSGGPDSLGASQRGFLYKSGGFNGAGAGHEDTSFAGAAVSSICCTYSSKPYGGRSIICSTEHMRVGCKMDGDGLILICK
jgi:hypothetical protein